MTALATLAAGFDHADVNKRMDAADAIRRRTLQIAAIARLMGAVGPDSGKVTDATMENAAWAVADLADDIDRLAGLLQDMPAKPEVSEPTRLAAA
ncbi:hypothetical protein ACKVEX_05650 [Rhodocyclaceae bacterium SMB388]